MQRTRSPRKQNNVTRQQANAGILRTAKRLRSKYPDGIAFEEPYWLGWVLGVRNGEEMFLTTSFYYHDTIFKLTPAGWLLLAPDKVVARLQKKIKGFVERKR